MEEIIQDLKPAKKTFSRIGFSLCVILALTTFLQLILSGLLLAVLPEDHWLSTTSWGMWLMTFVPMYLVAMPIGLLILRKLPAAAPESKPLKVGDFLILLPICFFVTYAGSFIGSTLSGILSGGQAENALDAYAMDTNPIKILVMVIIGPLLEEYICRKQIIDRTRQYGEKLAVCLSAVTFALFHGNLFQFFYAFAGGWIFAYIYLRTGRLRYPFLLHAIINFMGSVVAPWILTRIDMDAISSIDPTLPPEELMAIYAQYLPGMLLMLLYAFLLMGLAIAGLVLVIVYRNKLVWKDAADPLPKGSHFKTVYVNAGMILFALICLGLTVLALF